MYEKISYYDWLFDVRYYESPRVILFKTNVDDASTITVGDYSSIIEVLLAQDFGNTLTAAPVSIK